MAGAAIPTGDLSFVFRPEDVDDALTYAGRVAKFRSLSGGGDKITFNVDGSLDSFRLFTVVAETEIGAIDMDVDDSASSKTVEFAKRRWGGTTSLAPGYAKKTKNLAAKRANGRYKSRYFDLRVDAGATTNALATTMAVPWFLPARFDAQVTAHVDDLTKIAFKFVAGLHDVYLMANEAAYAACDFTGAAEVTTGEFLVSAGGVYRFASSVGTQCASGLKQEYVVEPLPSPPPPSPPPPNPAPPDFTAEDLAFPGVELAPVALEECVVFPTDGSSVVVANLGPGVSVPINLQKDPLEADAASGTYRRRNLLQVELATLYVNGAPVATDGSVNVTNGDEIKIELCASTKYDTTTWVDMYVGTGDTAVHDRVKITTLAEPPHDVAIAFDGQTYQACAGDRVRVVWDGYHNIQETETAECGSADVGNQTTGFYSAGHVRVFANDELAAAPGQTRYFKCDTHCSGSSARFAVTCPPPSPPPLAVSTTPVVAGPQTFSKLAIYAEQPLATDAKLVELRINLADGSHVGNATVDRIDAITLGSLAHNATISAFSALFDGDHATVAIAGAGPKYEYTVVLKAYSYNYGATASDADSTHPDLHVCEPEGMSGVTVKTPNGGGLAETGKAGCWSFARDTITVDIGDIVMTFSSAARITSARFTAGRTRYQPAFDIYENDALVVADDIVAGVDTTLTSTQLDAETTKILSWTDAPAPTVAGPLTYETPWKYSVALKAYSYEWDNEASLYRMFTFCDASSLPNIKYEIPFGGEVGICKSWYKNDQGGSFVNIGEVIVTFSSPTRITSFSPTSTLSKKYQPAFDVYENGVLVVSDDTAPGAGDTHFTKTFGWSSVPGAQPTATVTFDLASPVAVTGGRLLTKDGAPSGLAVYGSNDGGATWTRAASLDVISTARNYGGGSHDVFGATPAGAHVYKFVAANVLVDTQTTLGGCDCTDTCDTHGNWYEPWCYVASTCADPAKTGTPAWAPCQVTRVGDVSAYLPDGTEYVFPASELTHVSPLIPSGQTEQVADFLTFDAPPENGT